MVPRGEPGSCPRAPRICPRGSATATCMRSCARRRRGAKPQRRTHHDRPPDPPDDDVQTRHMFPSAACREDRLRPCACHRCARNVPLTSPHHHREARWSPSPTAKRCGGGCKRPNTRSVRRRRILPQMALHLGAGGPRRSEAQPWWRGCARRPPTTIARRDGPPPPQRSAVGEDASWTVPETVDTKTQRPHPLECSSAVSACALNARPKRQSEERRAPCGRHLELAGRAQRCVHDALPTQQLLWLPH